MLCPDMILRHVLRIFIQRSKAYDHGHRAMTLGDQMRTATRAEVSSLARRRLKGAQPFLSASPSEMLTQNTGRGNECSCVSLAARVTVTMADGHIDAVYFIAHGPAGATSVHDSLSLVAKNLHSYVAIDNALLRW